MKIIQFWNKFVLFSFLITFTARIFAEDLVVEVLDEHKSSGTLFIQLFQLPEQTSKEPRQWEGLIAKEKRELAMKSGIAKLTFSNLEKGWYAIRLFLDENQNRVLDYSFTGRPKEGVGFSNNPKLSKGQPKVEQVAFEMLESGAMQIALLKKKKRAKKNH